MGIPNFKIAPVSRATSPKIFGSVPPPDDSELDHPTPLAARFVLENARTDAAGDASTPVVMRVARAKGEGRGGEALAPYLRACGGVGVRPSLSGAYRCG